MTTTSLPVDHAGLGVMPQEECLYHLRTARFGRLAFLADGYPTILPVNHSMDGSTVVFRTASGSKLTAADNGMPVAFQVDGADADRRAAWSVLVRGDTQVVHDPVVLARLNELGVWPWADGVERNSWVQVLAHEMTGRMIVHTRRA